jgi:rhamnosyltransferase
VTKASIVIPTFNGAATLEACLRRVFEQRAPWAFDVQVVDSGSVDGTLDIVARYPATLSTIPNSSFGHGRTRQAAARAVGGEYVVFLVQDAEPLNDRWLATLVEAADANGAAGAFGSQVPRPGAGPYARYEMAGSLPVESGPVLKRLATPETWDGLSPQERYRLAFFHNANACLRRDVLARIPMRDLPYGEDMDWARRALLAGHGLVYEPRARVIHSHDRSPVYTFRRAYSDHSLVWDQFGWRMVPHAYSVLRGLAWTARDAWRWSGQAGMPVPERIAATGSIAVHGTLLQAGAYLGARIAAMPSRPVYAVQLDRLMRRGV